MADTKISALTAATSLTGDEVVAVVQGGATKKAAIDLIRPRSNLTANAAPTVGDDSGDGYSVGSLWQWEERGRVWRCRDATLGAAKWTEFSTGTHPGYIAGLYYQTTPVQTGVNVGVTTHHRFTPFVIHSRVRMSELGSRVTTAAASATFALAIYANNPATNRPTGAPLAETGSLDAATTGYKSAAIDVTLEPGVYWLASTVNDITIAFWGANLGVSNVAVMAGATSAPGTFGTAGGIGLYTVATSMTFGNVTSATWAESNSSGYNGPAAAFRAHATQP